MDFKALKNRNYLLKQTKLVFKVDSSSSGSEIIMDDGNNGGIHEPMSKSSPAKCSTKIKINDLMLK
jgi:hypothetical protein